MYLSLFILRVTYVYVFYLNVENGPFATFFTTFLYLT